MYVYRNLVRKGKKRVVCNGISIKNRCQTHRYRGRESWKKQSPLLITFPLCFHPTQVIKELPFKARRMWNLVFARPLPFWNCEQGRKVDRDLDLPTPFRFTHSGQRGLTSKTLVTMHSREHGGNAMGTNRQKSFSSVVSSWVDSLAIE